MSNPSILAATLLMTGPVAVPAPLTLVPAETLVSQQVQGINGPRDRVVTRPGVLTPPPQIEIEFSQPRDELTPWTELSNLVPRSGSQLYQQRLAALRAGQLYTRLAPSSFYQDWANVKETPTHQQWIELLGQEAMALADGQGHNGLRILLGDSLSMWFPTQLLPQDQFWLNQGISGENTKQVLQRLSFLEGTRPETIYLMVGINDLRQGVDDLTILSNLRAIVRHLRQHHPQAEIITQSILPTRLGFISNTRIRGLNQQISLIARQEGVRYLNLYPLFADLGGQLKPNLTTDGLHLSYQGYQVWQAALEAMAQADAGAIAPNLLSENGLSPNQD